MDIYYQRIKTADSDELVYSKSGKDFSNRIFLTTKYIKDIANRRHIVAKALKIKPAILWLYNIDK